MTIASPFILKKAVLATNRLGSATEVSHDIRGAIQDVNIHEHITQPYTVAQITFADTKDTLSSLDIQGGEYIDLLVEPANYQGIQGITKRYYVMSIEKGVRAGANAELILLNCIDEIGFRSYLKNLNILLQGTSLDMLVRISNEFLDTDIIHNEETYEQTYKIIVPNMTPLRTMQWIAAKAITQIGMPHFLFASFADKNLRFLDLERILTYDTVNPNTPFTYGFTSSNLQNIFDLESQTYSISSYTYHDNHNIGDIIKEGSLSGVHSYYDTLRNKEFKFEYRAADTFTHMFEADLFEDGQQRVPIAPAMTMDNELLHDFMSRKVYSMATTGAWNDGYNTYNERLDIAGYTADASNEAIRTFMKKDTLSWKFSGKYFGAISGGQYDGAHLLGKKLRVVFSKADPDHMNTTSAMVDMKKSGDYIITGVKHQLNKESYNIICTGSKMSTLNTSVFTKGFG